MRATHAEDFPRGPSPSMSKLFVSRLFPAPLVRFYLKMLPSKINTQIPNRFLLEGQCFLCRQFRFAKTDKVFVISKSATHFRSNAMNATLIFLHVVEDTSPKQSRLIFQIVKELFWKRFQLLVYHFIFLLCYGNRSTTQSFTALARQCLHIIYNLSQCDVC